MKTIFRVDKTEEYLVEYDYMLQLNNTSLVECGTRLFQVIRTRFNANQEEYTYYMEEL